MARARRAGDTTETARKRYRRAAERYLKKSEDTAGATSARYRKLAEQNLRDAISTYETTSTIKSKPIQRLAAEFGIDVTDRRIFTESSDVRRARVDKSKSVLESSFDDYQARREAEAKALLKNPEIGNRIYGGLVTVWEDRVKDVSGKVDNSKIDDVLMGYFGVDNLADMLEKLESAIGGKLYEFGDSDELYEIVKLMIQNKVKENTLVQ